MPDEDEQLRGLLGTDPPASVLALDDDARRSLTEVLREARERQTRVLEESFNAALRHVPFPVRGIVKRILIG